MPRDGNGDYTLPPLNPVQSGTTILSNWANSTMPDLGDAMTDSLSRSGQGGMLVSFKVVDGALNTPAIGFQTEPSLGFYRPAFGTIAFVSQSGETLRIRPSGNVSTAAAAPTNANDLTRKDYVDGLVNGLDSQNVKLTGDQSVGGQKTFTDNATFAGNVSVGGGALQLGVEDSQAGQMTLYGAATGSSQGGQINLQTAADYDGTVAAWYLDAEEDDFRIGGAGAGVALTITPARDATFAGTVTIADTDSYRWGDGNERIVANNAGTMNFIVNNATAQSFNSSGNATFAGNVSIDGGAIILDGEIGAAAPSINGEGVVGVANSSGVVIRGKGSNFDFQLQNSTSQNVLTVPTGTTSSVFVGVPSTSAPQGTTATALTRKDYVDQAIADAIAAIPPSNVDFPVGAMLIGFNPTGLFPGTWEQLPEGTFLMNTIGGADPSGGNNNAVTIAHIHTATQPTHFHTATQGTHSHSAAGAHTHPILAGSNDGNGIFVDNVTTGTNNGTKTESGGSHSHPAASAGTITVAAKTAGAITVASTGVAGTGLNRPKYVGVDVWKRTA